MRATLELRRQQLAALKVRAGIDGVLQRLGDHDPLQVGQQLAAGANIARVADPAKLKAEIKVVETQAKDIQHGQKAEIDTRNGTLPGHVIRIDPAVINPQGAAGNGVAGVRLAEDGDEVIAALPITGADTEAILSLSEKGWKVTACADIPVKGRGGAGVGFHPFVAGENMLLSATVSATGFTRGGKRVRAESRSKSTVKGAGSDVTPTAVTG